ncbi:MAG TPA: enoyl-CoA hydratase [Acidimicrobiales bacterium]|nr:enoyl-CoA hydratase [Acidimicrobiales bacterium]
MDSLLVERDGGVLTLTLNRPERRNAMTPDMWVELRRLLAEAASDRAERVVVLTGAGGAFCSGVDLASLGESQDHQLVRMRLVSDAVLELHRLPKPTIAKVTGIAAGAGCNLALACDLVVASESARFSQLFAKRGLSIDSGGSWLLPRMVGLHRAKELAFFADTLDASQARDLGLVNRVVPDAEVDALVGEWSARLAAGPPLALAMTKSMLNASGSLSMDQALDEEARAQALNATTADAREAMRAFAEKRPPRFEGR